MAFQTLLLLTGSLFSSQNFDHPYVIFLAFNKNYQLFFILKQMAKPKVRII